MKARRGEIDLLVFIVCLGLAAVILSLIISPPRPAPQAVEAPTLYRVTYPGGEVLATRLSYWGPERTVLELTLPDGSTALLGGTWQVLPVRPSK